MAAVERIITMYIPATSTLKIGDAHLKITTILYHRSPFCWKYSKNILNHYPLIKSIFIIFCMRATGKISKKIIKLQSSII